MARISTYSNDTSINDNDRLIGTDGGTGVAGSGGTTRNFTIGALAEYINSRDSSVTGNYATDLITTTNLTEGLQLFTAHAFYSTNMGGGTLMAVLPSAPSDGSWVRISAIGNTGVALYAGAVDAAEARRASEGNRFMAGISHNGSPASDPHLLTVPSNQRPSFELIYIADNFQDGNPVGWVIVN